MAIDTIEELSKDIHNQFAPRINKKVSEIVEHITNKKYNRVRVSGDLEVSVGNPITKEIINIDSLSGGTIDQLYFALRFGIINSMGENKLSLILDDCFIQYDDNRIKGVIDLLSTIGRERQIILFTCHSREKTIMEEISLDFNYLHLT